MKSLRVLKALTCSRPEDGLSCSLDRALAESMAIFVYKFKKFKILKNIVTLILMRTVIADITPGISKH